MMATKSSSLQLTTTTTTAAQVSTDSQQQPTHVNHKNHHVNNQHDDDDQHRHHHHQQQQQIEHLQLQIHHSQQNLQHQQQQQQDHNNNLNHLPLINHFFSNFTSENSGGLLVNNTNCVSSDDDVVAGSSHILTDMIKIEDDHFHHYLHRHHHHHHHHYNHQRQQQHQQSIQLQHNSLTDHNSNNHHHLYQQQQQQQPYLVSQQQQQQFNHQHKHHQINTDLTNDSPPNSSSSSASSLSSLSSLSLLSSSVVVVNRQQQQQQNQQKSDQHLNLNLVTRNNKSSPAANSSHQQQQSLTLPSSPAMLMNHLDLSSMRSSPSSAISSSSTASRTSLSTSNENVTATNLTTTTINSSSSSSSSLKTTTSSTNASTSLTNTNYIQHLSTTATLNNNNDNTSNAHRSHQQHHHHNQQIRNFDTNKIYYGENNINNDDSSCQSLPNVPDSSKIVQNTKTLALQSSTNDIIITGSSTTNDSITNQNNDNSASIITDDKLVKRIRFKGSLVNEHHDHDQNEQKLLDNSKVDHQSDNQLSAAADHHSSDSLDQNPFAYRPADTESSSIYSSRNDVANCYGYAWRRWSKTDAPSVKNQAAGTVQVPHTMPRIDDEDDRKFQYILGAPTSAGTRVGLMTMTYLNQGQSYEIRLKKLKKIPHEPNLKTLVRLGFVEKRLQYRENEELSGWVQAHNNGRMIDIDFSMSYGVFDVDLRSQFNHSITFVWNPGREASIFIKINCISTEFTSKRHGGERGTPFRLIVDTYSIDGNKIDSACCLIKVFKSKGAERKHKTDRDRVAKHPDSENYYQPSYDCTLLTNFKEEEQSVVTTIHQHEFDNQNNDSSSISTSLTNRSMTESPTCSELSIVTSATMPNTPISSHDLMNNHNHHHHHNSNNNNNINNNQSLILDHSSSLSSISHNNNNGNNDNNNNLHHQTTPPISSSSNLSKLDTTTFDHCHSHHHHHHLMSSSSSKSTDQLNSLPGSSSSLAMVASSCQQGGPGGEFSMSTATLTISSPIMANSNSQSQSSTCSKFVEKFDSEPGIVRTSSLSLSIRSISPSITSMMKNFGSSSSLTPTSAFNGLPFDAGAIETYEWLKRNRFFRLAEQLCDYTADDLRRLSRDDLIQLCDFKDGIRLYNLIHMPEITATKLTLFITFDGNEHYALYFKQLTMEEFRDKLGECMFNNNIVAENNCKNNNDSQQQQQSVETTLSSSIRLRNIHMTGPNSIRVKLTNEVLQNMKNESIYRCYLTKVDNEFDVVIGLIQNQNQNQNSQQQV